MLTLFHKQLWQSYQKERDAAAGGYAREGSALHDVCEAFPTLLSYECAEGQEAQLRCCDSLAVAAAVERAAATGAPLAVQATAAVAAAEELRVFVVEKALHYPVQRARNQDPASPQDAEQAEATAQGWVQVPWLVRAVEKRLAAYVLLAPRPDLARAADPGRYALRTASEAERDRR